MGTLPVAYGLCRGMELRGIGLVGMGFFSAVSHEQAPAWEKKPGLVPSGRRDGARGRYFELKLGPCLNSRSRCQSGHPAASLPCGFRSLPAKAGKSLP